MRSIVRVASVAAAATLAGLVLPSVAAAEVTGEIAVDASSVGSDVIVTVTDTVAEDFPARICQVALEAVEVEESTPLPSEPEFFFLLPAAAIPSLPEGFPVERAFPYPETGEYAHTFTGVPDGEWQIDYFCAVFDGQSDAPAGYWLTPGIPPAPDLELEANRESIPVTVAGGESEGLDETAPETLGEPQGTVPEISGEPECTSLSCLLLSGSAGDN
ncbi:hypothetical protein OED52_18295 [Rhodococcus sp. Z13]|uniref:Uncharacterized protein n=1 Tax=Rhodococcus sacchari TaxID=2962047 RepID=A0ACD4DER4_9NOCA|nr:hypothetical protein [Rhodococcus sp. Z13]UYP18572.1 hypothetical protein OED52_18295 [Rhodococcus sp. Z13]